MKKNLKHLCAPLFFLFIVGNISAQTNPIPNNGFENWTNPDENPDSWDALRLSIPFIGDVVTAYRSPLSHSGSYALLLKSATFPPAPLPGIPLPGIATTGILNILTFSSQGLFELEKKPDVLKGFYMYKPSGSDTASVQVLLTRYNPDTDKRDTIASGVKYFRNEVSVYTEFIVPLVYTNFLKADSASITIYSSSTSAAVAGSMLYIDDLEFYPTWALGLEELHGNRNTKIYPNPTPDHAVLLSEIKSRSLFVLYDISGRTILEKSFEGGELPLDFSPFKKGLYLYKVYLNNGELVDTGKISLINN